MSAGWTSLSRCEPEELGKASRVDDAPGRYDSTKYCADEFTLDGMHLVLDCAHGATYHVAPKVFRELGAK